MDRIIHQVDPNPKISMTHIENPLALTGQNSVSSPQTFLSLTKRHFGSSVRPERISLQCLPSIDSLFPPNRSPPDDDSINGNGGLFHQPPFVESLFLPSNSWPDSSANGERTPCLSPASLGSIFPSNLSVPLSSLTDRSTTFSGASIQKLFPAAVSQTCSDISAEKISDFSPSILSIFPLNRSLRRSVVSDKSPSTASGSVDSIYRPYSEERLRPSNAPERERADEDRFLFCYSPPGNDSSLHIHIRSNVKLHQEASSSGLLSYKSILPVPHSSAVPLSYDEAVLDPKWRHAIDAELKALEKMRSWELVPLPEGQEAIGCHWVYSLKSDSDGSTRCYKALLVASDPYDVDLTETNNVVARMTIFRVLMAAAYLLEWKMYQIDFKDAFLHGELDNEVYMTPPPGLNHELGQVCRLQRTVCGLKQGRHAFLGKFRMEILRAGFKQLSNEPVVFHKRTISESEVFILHLADEMIVGGSDDSEISKLERFLHDKFEMKDMVPLRKFLGIEFTECCLSQSKYIADVINQFQVKETSKGGGDLDFDITFKGRGGLEMSGSTLYRLLVGCFMHITITRPDIAYYVNALNRSISHPNSSSWAVIARVLQHLSKSPEWDLPIAAPSSLHDIVAFCDIYTSPSAGTALGSCILLGGTLISWNVEKVNFEFLGYWCKNYQSAVRPLVAEIIRIQDLVSSIRREPYGLVPLLCDACSEPFQFPDTNILVQPCSSGERQLAQVFSRRPHCNSFLKLYLSLPYFRNSTWLKLIAEKIKKAQHGGS